MNLFCKKNLLKVLLILSFFSSLNSYTNKTYLRPLDSDFLRPTKTTFAEFAAEQYDAEDLDIKHNLGVSGFGFWSTNGEAIGRYFGVNEKNNVVVSGESNDMDVFHGYLIHLPGVTNGETKVNLNSKTQYLGVNLLAVCDLSRLIENLYFKLTLPFMQVKNKPNASFSSSDYEEDEDSGVIKKYLNGEYENLESASGREQEALRYSKINGEKSKVSFADMDISLGYAIWDSNVDNVFLKLGLIVPLGNKPKGEYLFEPVCGNGGSWGVDFGGNGYINIFEKGCGNLNFLFDLNYKYLFGNSQTRILSVKGANWGQFYLLGKKGTTDPLIPAANLLTKRVSVSSLSQLDCDLSFSYNFNNLDLNLGLGALFREEEKIKLKDSIIEDTYAVSDPTYDFDNDFDTNDIASGFGYNWLNDKSIDLNASRSEQVFTYKIYAGLRYILDFWDNGFFVDFKLGGAYHFAPRNSNFRGYALDLGLNVYF